MSVYDSKRDLGLPKPKRNKFDLSKNSHVGVQLGRITPIYCKQVIPGDSFNIKPNYGIRFQPMVYPIASKMHVYTSWYFVPYATLWKRQSNSRKGGWREFITDANSRMKGVADGKKFTFNFPYISNDSDDFWKSGSLFDCLGGPTTLPKMDTAPFMASSRLYYGKNAIVREGHSLNHGENVNADLANTPLSITSMSSNGLYRNNRYLGMMMQEYIKTRVSLNSTLKLKFIGNPSATFLNKNVICQIYVSNDGNNWDYQSAPAFVSLPITATDANGWAEVTNSTAKVTLYNRINSEIDKGNYVCLAFLTDYSNPLNFDSTFFSAPDVLCTDADFKTCERMTLSSVECNSIVDAVEVGLCPFKRNGSETAPARKISAFPFRAYEAIYNAYFRRVDIDPYTDPATGVVNYDTFCDTREGADTFNYDFHYKRLVSDIYTSCDPVPVWYDAPVVNIVTDTASDSSVTLRVKGFEKDPSSMKEYTVVLSDGQPASVRPIGEQHDGTEEITKILKASLGHGTGITMRDFQNAKAMETYLSACMRIGAGYCKYLEKIHGTKSDRDDDFSINIPRYLGGTATTIDVETLMQQSATSEKALGEYEGFATAGDSGSISCYAGEHGLIMGLMSVVPHTANADRIDNHFNIPINELSYPSGEFLHLQEQPVTYDSMCPIVAYKDFNDDKTKKITDTFGYNDCWAEYKSDLDEVHGLFRKEYADYVVTRQFGSRPSLNKNYVTCNPDALTDPFKVSHTNGDIGICHLCFDVKAVRPLPTMVIPKI